MAVDIMEQIQVSQKSWELSKFTDEELHTELELRARLAAMERAESLYAYKDVVDYDENGNPFNTETL